MLTSATRGGEAADAAAAPVAIQWNAIRSRVEIIGLPPEALAAILDAKLDREQWAQLFSVAVADDAATTAPPMLGQHAVDGEVLVFTPRFPLRPGLDYRATFDPSRVAALPPAVAAVPRFEATLTLPQPAAAAPTTVVAVYPSGDELPENLLKFYLHFSAPMSRGDDYRHVHIVDHAGAVVSDAFLELPDELWDAEGRRLTLLFDPGRIKRGLKPNDDVGSPLLVGRRYALVIDADWRDGRGNALASSFRKEFRVTRPDDVQPDPRAWRLEPPRAGTLDPLAVKFNEPLDHALLEHLLKVCDANSRAFSGHVVIDEHETRWSYRPAKTWRPGEYRLVVDADLEDRAGNSIGRAFETRGESATVGASSDEPVELRFKIGAPTP